MAANDESMDDVIHLETLTPDECLTAMAGQPVGRLVLAQPDGYPLVAPVNFVLDGQTIVFRTGPGTHFGRVQQKVSFEVDHIEPDTRTGWSVLVRGTIYEASLWEIEHLNLEPW